jgi:hypothetical protein
MQHLRFLVIAVLGAVLVGLVLGRGVGPAVNPLAEAARLLGTTRHPGFAFPGACEPDPTLAAEHPKPGIAAFVEVEGSLFQILVGQDREGETWSAAVSGEE